MAGDLPESEKELGRKLAAVMAKAFKYRGERMMNVSSPSKRLNLRGIAEGRMDKPFRRKETETHGVPHVTLIVDCSGSMRNTPEINARAMAVAINILAQQGTIRATGYATAEGGVYDSVEMPCRTSRFLPWSAFSGDEGMRETFEQKKAEMSESDIVIVMTDGMLGSAPDKQALHARGVFVIGAYAKPLAPADQSKVSSYLRSYFDKGVVRPDVMNLADALGQIIAGRA